MIKKLLLFSFLVYNMLFSQSETQKSESFNYIGASAISVTIGGTFFVTGTFPASPNERVDQFLTRIFNSYISSSSEKNERTIDQTDLLKTVAFSKRDIVLKRLNGDTLKIDLLKFRITGDFKFNPYLKNDDVLIIPPQNLETNFITINGAVNVPGTFQFVEGDKLSDAVLLAQGLNPAYENVIKAIINRLSIDGEKEQEITVTISENPALSRGDRIRIISEEVERKDYKVYIAGEVYLPGDIPITKNSSTLRQIIQKAGGIKPTADMNRAEIVRGANVFKSILFTEEFEYYLMQRMSNITMEDSLPFAVDNKLRFSRGNGTIDFNKIFDENSYDGNFIVKSGDYIFIPEKVNLVYIFGQVNSPGYVEYQSGKDVSYYLEKAGGTGLTAKKDIYLIKGKNRSWVRLNQKNGNYITIESGDYIWVPKKPKRDFDYYLQKVGSVSAVIGSVATLILLLLQATK